MLHAFAECPAAFHIPDPCVHNCGEVVGMLVGIAFQMLITLAWTLAIGSICILGIGTKTSHSADALAQRQSGVDACTENEERGPHIQQAIEHGAIVVELVTESVL